MYYENASSKLFVAMTLYHAFTLIPYNIPCVIVNMLVVSIGLIIVNVL